MLHVSKGSAFHHGLVSLYRFNGHSVRQRHLFHLDSLLPKHEQNTTELPGISSSRRLGLHCYRNCFLCKYHDLSGTLFGKSSGVLLLKNFQRKMPATLSSGTFFKSLFYYAAMFPAFRVLIQEKIISIAVTNPTNEDTPIKTCWIFVIMFTGSPPITSVISVKKSKLNNPD